MCCVLSKTSFTSIVWNNKVRSERLCETMHLHTLVRGYAARICDKYQTLALLYILRAETSVIIITSKPQHSVAISDQPFPNHSSTEINIASLFTAIACKIYEFRKRYLLTAYLRLLSTYQRYKLTWNKINWYIKLNYPTNFSVSFSVIKLYIVKVADRLTVDILPYYK